MIVECSEGIQSIVLKNLQKVDNTELRQEFIKTYGSRIAIKTIEQTQAFFSELTTSSTLDETQLRNFLNAYNTVHGTSTYVAALMIRLGRLARDSRNNSSKQNFFTAQQEIGEIIAEDTGVDDVPHLELFEKFALAVIGDDSWKSSQYRNLVCVEFRDYVKGQRIGRRGDFLIGEEEGILTTAASEIFNSGEYTFFSNLIDRWFTQTLDKGIISRKDALAYVKVHAGETESGHFIHALKAWELYCTALGKKPDVEIAREISLDYLLRIGKCFESMRQNLRG